MTRWWSPGRLVEVVNEVLGTGYVARSTVSEWLHLDRLPRDPLPTVVAHLIAEVRALQDQLRATHAA